MGRRIKLTTRLVVVEPEQIARLLGSLGRALDPDFCNDVAEAEAAMRESDALLERVDTMFFSPEEVIRRRRIEALKAELAELETTHDSRKGERV